MTDAPEIVEMSDSEDAALSNESIREEKQPTIDPVTDIFLGQLRETISQQHNKAVFACDGAVPISNNGTPSDKRVISAPVALRWDGPAEALSKDRKLILPLEPETEGKLENLANDTEPASFGLQGQDVFDENYRKASKMDIDKFASTFNPYELGIVDTIAQILLPSILDSKHHRAVRAELYKLNVYSGPSGKFKAHVDTPRSKYQFGSLVCLPVEHEGGQLQVRHKGKEMMTFDWSTSKTDRDHACIRWAAFYSDCEHEVIKVDSGHRITLTYNLYAVRGNDLLAGHCPSLDPTHLPLYQFIDMMFREPQFLKDGGYLGFFCTHAYAHSNTDHIVLPDMLKGLDMVIWETLTGLGLQTEVKPVLFTDRSDCDYKGLDGDEFENKFPEAILGSDFRMYKDSYDRVDGWEELKGVYTGWGWDEDDIRYRNVHWLTEPGPMELQLLYKAYGNEASSATAYSHCAIVAKIGSPGERGTKDDVDKAEDTSGEEDCDGSSSE